MPIGSVTCGANSVQLTSGPQRAMQLIFNPAANNYTVGDSSSLNASTGVKVPTTASPLSIGPFTSGAVNLDQWYVFGASGTVVTYQYTPEE